MNKADISVRELVEMIGRGELRLPEMQRRYVWRSTRVRDLLDSLYRGYPSGSILVWETDKVQPSRDLAVQQDASPFAGRKLLLDGQQRLTSLTAVLKGEPIVVRDRRKPIEILFNLDHPVNLVEFTEVDSDADPYLKDDDDDDEEENGESLQERLRQMTFVVASNILAQQPNWVSVTDVFRSESDKDILQHAGVTSFDDPRYQDYSEKLRRLRNIKNYLYSVNVLSKDLSYEEVAEIFVRVNSLGAKLRGSDLALAQITARWQNSLGLLEEFQEECEESQMSLDLGLLVRAMVVFSTGQSRFNSVANISTQRLKDGWEKAKDGLRYAVNFLRTNAGIEDESLLSSPLFFITIAYFSQARHETMTPDDERGLLYWLYTANAKGRYSRGSTETLLDADLNTLKKGGGPKELLETVKQQFGRLDVQAVDFVGRGVSSPLFPTVFLALKANDAKDWQTGLKLSLSHQGKYHYIQYHHIFPKSLLKGQYDKGEINEIANMAFISGRTNRKISNKEPKQYLNEIVNSHGKEVVLKQLVPLDQDLLELKDYRNFLQRRRDLLADAVNKFIQNVH